MKTHHGLLANGHNQSANNGWTYVRHWCCKHWATFICQIYTTLQPTNRKFSFCF